jgi:hypothetical protein
LTERELAAGGTQMSNSLHYDASKGQRWPRLFGQNFRFDKWNVCRG